MQDGLALALADRDSTVRFQAIVGLSEVGPTASPLLRAALIKEPDAVNQALLAETLGTVADPLAVPILTAIVSDARRTESVRSAALAALARSRDPQSLRARFALLYDPKAPASLVARALPDLARSGFLPPNDLASFLEHPAPSVRAAALLSLNVKKALPADLQQSVVDRLGDKDAEVREAAMLAVVPLQLRAAVPRLLDIAGDARSPDRVAAIEALCGIPDPRAVSFYLAAIQDRDPRLRRAGESALLAIRDQVTRSARLGSLDRRRSPNRRRLTLERVLARFEPIRDWRVIGPFPRTTAQLFVGEPLDQLCPSPSRRPRPIGLVGVPAGRPGDRPRGPERLQARGRRSGRVRLRQQRLARSWRLRVHRGRGRPRRPGPLADRLERHADRDRQ